MKTTNSIATSALLCLSIDGFTGTATAAGPSVKTFLTDGWELQSSAKIQVGGDAISSPAYVPPDWYPAKVPSTVVGTLVDDKVYPDPFFGMNFRSLPGMDYPIASNFTPRPISDSSPFKVSWWYRKVFPVTLGRDGQVWLNFDGINCRANIWLNGRRIADTNQIIGAYRTYRFNITDSVRPNQSNVLAVEIFPPRVNDLAITWVDWNPSAPDKEMGLWRDVYVTTTGPVALHDPQVLTRVDLPSLDKARLTVSADLQNPGPHPVKATLKGRIEGIGFQQTVDLGAQETRRVTFTPDQFPQLIIKQPRLWWPAPVGPQNRYDLNLQVNVNRTPSDQELIRFGIREMSSELTGKGYRLFRVNGRPILIRGGGWAPDLFLRPSAEREIQEIRYVKDMHLNTIRFEGKTESNRFLDLCDQEGIMVIAGWCCCDYWEHCERWSDIDYNVAATSLRDQILRVRNHPAIITWWYGSDRHPNERAETNYLNVFKQFNWPNSFQSSATAAQSLAGEPTGMRMKGPYDYVAPVYWFADTNHGGAYSFNTETSPGPAVPPIESIRRMIPKEHLWPIDEFWRFHSGGGVFSNLNLFTDALDNRFGQSTNVEDYARKAQLLSYEGQRAMFEAYGRNKYDSTGVIQWMMNNAWPSMIWHLYDYYLRPGGGYFGSKLACEPLHIQFSPDNHSVVVVNSYYRTFTGLKATAKIYNLDMTEKYSQETALDIASDGSKRVFSLPEPAGLSSTYFVKLTLKDAGDKPFSDNFYWVSTRHETIGQPREATWYYTPTKEYADYTLLNTLPTVNVKLSASSTRKGDQEITRVTVENPSRSLAFFIRLKANQAGEEILPVVWQDNYISLLPGEKREITATYAASQLHGSRPVVEIEGWNVPLKTSPPARR